MDKKMKKNKALRAAGGLFVATMLTTSVVSGTYAKYVTEGSGGGDARVAKFGVQVKADGELFSETYIDAPATGENLTVVSSEKVVAPGTKNEDGLKLSVTGSPEVAVKIKVDIEGIQDVYLLEGEYPDVTTAQTGDTFNIDSNGYYPVKYTLKLGKNGESFNGSLKEIQAQLAEYTNDTIYYPGESLDTQIGDITLTWAWEYGKEEGINVNDPSPVNDKADTLLGDLAAAFAFEEGDTAPQTTQYNLTTKVTLNVRVVQVD